MKLRQKLIACLVSSVILSPAYGESGSFSTLTYNVAGLLEAFSSAETNRQTATEQISCYVNQFDIVNVQEDFNYHAALYDTCNLHPYRTSTTGGMGIGSGLNTMSYYPFQSLKRVGWNNCNGVDCLTPKGFTFAQVRLAKGVYLDIYNLHTQAQTETADLDARRQNVLQLLDYIASESANNAVVVMGDTNTRYTRAGDNAWAFLDAGFSDVWVERIRAGNVPAINSEALVCDPKITAYNCEIVDKIYYKNNGFIQLTPLAYEVREDDENSEGKKLSDHPPVAVDWQYLTNSQFTFSDHVGGSGGTGFNDINAITTSPSVQKISLRAGSRVDQVAITLNNGTTLSHGGQGGTYQSMTLNSGEYIASAKVCTGEKSGSNRVFYASFTTNLGRSLTGGTTTDQCQQWQAQSGWKINGFHGRAGTELDQVGLIFTPI